MELKTELIELLDAHKGVFPNMERGEVIRQVMKRKEAIASSKHGFLYTLTPPESTGRSPKDTFIVRDDESEKYVDWDSPNNIPMDPDTFQMLWHDALADLKKKRKIFITDRVIGSDSAYALPVKTVTDKALTALFTMNMFRPIPEDIQKSVFAKKEFHLLVLPYNKIDAERYEGRLRVLDGGRTSDMAIVMDLKNRLGLVYGSAYSGSAKKLMFTVMNYYLPFEKILPIHCSANENTTGEISLFLGLSGTGKTTLSADPDRALLGDDEHGWDDSGIANFEYGCYAKLIDLNPQKEPEIYQAVFHKDEPENHGAIVENAMVYFDGAFDLSDKRLTENSRASYPLSFLSNIKVSSKGVHPKTIIFLTADANGVLPPVSRLNHNQAMLWFLMGYTSKLAGTETGIIEPETTFSRFFGQPFMPLLPKMYAELLGERLKKHNSSVFLVNTGWTGGPYGTGKRMDIVLTRLILNAALDGKLDDVEYQKSEIFHLEVPKSCPGVPSIVLSPKNTWPDRGSYERREMQLAMQFSRHFDKAYGNKNIAEAVRIECPGK